VTVGDFSIDALYAALDAERRARGLSWAQLAGEINRPVGRPRPRAIAASTLSGMRGQRAIEGDGVLQQLRWLRRTPESFVPGLADGDGAAFALPDVPPNRILRFDTRAIYAALDARRRERGLTWTQAAVEIGGVSAAGLTRYARGGRTGFPQVMHIALWLGRPAASLTRVAIGSPTFEV